MLFRLQDVSKYSKVVLNSSALVKDQQIYLNTTVHDMVLSEGQLGQQVIDKLFDAKITPSSHCGQDLHGLNSSARLGTRANFLASSVALVVLSYHAPRTLLNSMLTWQQGGLLGVVKERVALLNDPLDEEVGIAKAFGFRVVQPQDIPGAKTARRNVLTIGAAFYYSLHLVQSEFVLFLENDFKLDLQYGSFKVRGERWQVLATNYLPFHLTRIILYFAAGLVGRIGYAATRRAIGSVAIPIIPGLWKLSYLPTRRRTC